MQSVNYINSRHVKVKNLNIHSYHIEVGRYDFSIILDYTAECEGDLFLNTIENGMIYDVELEIKDLRIDRCLEFAYNVMTRESIEFYTDLYNCDLLDLDRQDGILDEISVDDIDIEKVKKVILNKDFQCKDEIAMNRFYGVWYYDKGCFYAVFLVKNKEISEYINKEIRDKNYKYYAYFLEEPIGTFDNFDDARNAVKTQFNKHVDKNQPQEYYDEILPLCYVDKNRVMMFNGNGETEELEWGRVWTLADDYIRIEEIEE